MRQLLLFVAVRIPVVAVTLLLLARHGRADNPAAAPQPQAVASPKEHSRGPKWIAAGSIAAIHGVYLTWQHFAWYRKGDQPFHYENGQGLGTDSYSGGEDKFGHFWGNYVLTRAQTAILVDSGWPRLPSSAVSFGLTELAYLLIEIQDGLAPWGFEINDVIANAFGGAFGVLMDNVPQLDRLVDFRVEYWPSKRYRHNLWRTGDVDGAQDYDGQSYIVAFHLGAIRNIADSDWGYWTRFVDVAAGFEARNYYPLIGDPARHQTLYAGLSINMQGILRALLPDSRGRQIGIGIAEAYSLPSTTFRYAEVSRSPQ